MQFQTLVFDLDDTVYPRSCGLMAAVGERIQTYLEQVTGMPREEAARARRDFLAIYGTTLSGLQAHHDVDPEAYMRFVHDIELEPYLRPNQRLGALLERLPQRKIIFTNSPREHAQAVLGALGVGRHFATILDIRDFGFSPKPNPAAYRRLLAELGHPPGEALYLDDRPENLRPAAELGLVTALVSENGGPASVAVCLGDVLEVESLLAAAPPARNGLTP